MAKFLTGDKLNSEIGEIFKNAKEKLILISPYIKLHHRFEEALKSKLDFPKLQIIIVFGKNEADITKSLTAYDLEFFKQFPNIEIRYEKRLHAKFYANEETQILTSMNLYEFSQNENIEAGVKAELNLIGALSDIASALNITKENAFDTETWAYFKTVIKNSTLLFKNNPDYDKGFLGSNINKKLVGIINVKDSISEHFADKIKTTKNETNAEYGYCIRTAERIPFNPERPYCDKAYKSWAQYKNPNYKEKYCHRTGKPSNGATSFSQPIL